MTNDTEGSPTRVRPATGWSVYVLAAALIAAFGGLFYQSRQVASVRQDLQRLTQTQQQQLEQFHGQMQANLAAAKGEVDQTLGNMSQQLETARNEARTGVKRAQITASKKAGEVLSKMNEKDQEFDQKLTELKQSNAEASTQVNEAITGIRTDVASTRTDLSGTQADLKRVTGDMGVMSGLIATNSKELEALKKLGDRDYFEFTLPKSSTPQRVGDIQLTLRKADVKRNRFTLVVLADDRRVEKRDKTINEPVQFYTGGTRIPYEIVVNQVRKNQVVGYLAVPKVKMPLRSGSAEILKAKS
ncbi:MAG: hypothetical protein LLG20_10055 [Acidobacteriales bacterium]|nr:hypothetical protein [Terriglobales bacterium]